MYTETGFFKEEVVRQVGSGEEESAIVSFKLQRLHRSARLIRDRLRNGVSEEAVRLVLVKHRLIGTGATADLGPSPLSI